MDFQLFHSFGKGKDRATTWYVSVFDPSTSGHVTRSQTSGFFNKQTLSYFIYNRELLCSDYVNSSINMYKIHFAKVQCPYFRVYTRKSVEIQRYPEIRYFLRKIREHDFHHLFDAFKLFWNQLFDKNALTYLKTKNAPITFYVF